LGVVPVFTLPPCSWYSVRSWPKSWYSLSVADTASASSVAIDQDDFEYALFNQLGGLGRAHERFGDQLAIMLKELNEALAAETQGETDENRPSRIRERGFPPHDAG
jgi:hypothetical protein